MDVAVKFRVVKSTVSVPIAAVSMIISKRLT